MVVRKLALGIICMAALACPWGKCGFAQDSSANSAETREQSGPLMPKIMGDFRKLRLTIPKARVSDVVDGVTIELNDKTKLRLTGIWVPWESDADPGETVRRAQALLSKVSKGRYVRVYQTKAEGTGRTNRMGQTLGQVERDDGLWLQGILLYAGLATVMTSESNPEMAARMYEVEADARKNNRGLWGDGRWNVLGPAQAKDFVNEYRVVQGRVFSTSMRENAFYINFSRDWRSDFTIMVPANKRLAFAKQGVNLMNLNGQLIRVRGFVRNHNGPLIEITHPDQIEVLKTEKAATAPATNARANGGQK